MNNTLLFRVSGRSGINLHLKKTLLAPFLDKLYLHMKARASFLQFYVINPDLFFLWCIKNKAFKEHSKKEKEKPS